MKDFGFRELFCEIVSGLALLFLIFSGWIIHSGLSMPEICTVIISLTSIEYLTSLLIVSYILGIIFDACGLTASEVVLDRVVCSTNPSEEEKKVFWRSVSGHVLNYRSEQWAFYACNRNLLILTPFIVVAWTWILFSLKGPGYSAIIFVFGAFLCFTFYKSMQTLLRLYNFITCSYEQ